MHPGGVLGSGGSWWLPGGSRGSCGFLCGSCGFLVAPGSADAAAEAATLQIELVLWGDSGRLLEAPTPLE